MVDSTAKRIETAIGSELEGKIVFSTDYAELVLLVLLASFETLCILVLEFFLKLLALLVLCLLSIFLML